MGIGCSFQFSWFENDSMFVNCLIEFYLIFVSFCKYNNKYSKNQEKFKNNKFLKKLGEYAAELPDHDIYQYGKK
jgi:hypothetical protein